MPGQYLPVADGRGVLREELERAGLPDRVEVDSAGTGDWHLGAPMDSRARAELSRRGYDGTGHRARQFEPPWLGRYDLVAGDGPGQPGAAAADGAGIVRPRTASG